MATIIRKTLCNRDCPDTCSIEAVIEDGRVVKLRGDKGHPITRGFLCYRTTLFPDRQNAPDRLTGPLVAKDGRFQTISWNAVLDLIAERLTAIRRESGPAAIFHYHSGGSLGALTTLTDYFFEQFGPVTIKRGDICSGAGDAAQHLDFGEEDSNDVFDLLNARNIILWGKNVSVSSPHLVPILKDATRNGARLVQVDPVYQKTGKFIDTYLQPRPGGDFALAMAVARRLFERGWIDPEAPQYCDNLPRFEALARSRTVEAWCQDADVSVEAADDLARRLGVERPTAILVGWGMGRRVNGAGIVRALDALSAISGNLGISGGGVSFYYKRRGAFDFSYLHGQAPRAVCEPLFGPTVLAAKDPPIRAIWVTAGNPVAMLPQSNTIVEALRTRDFVVVADSFMTDTAKLASVVLPTPTLLESDDLLGAYGHHYIGVARPVVDPPPGVKSDGEIMRELAQRVGLGHLFTASPREWKARIIEKELGPHGITVDTLEKGAVRNPLMPRILFEDRKFKTPSGRVNLMTSAPPERVASERYPLVLMSISTEKSQSSQWVEPQEGVAAVTVHPDACPAVGDGQLARMESCIAAMTVVVRHDARQRKDVVIVPKGGDWHAGRCANALLRARVSDLGEGGALYDEGVRLVPL